MNNVNARLTSPLFREPFQTLDDEFRASDMASYRDQLAQTWLKGDGIEIGALQSPIRLQSNVSSRYVDYRTRGENRSRYPELEGYDIVETDIVDDGFILKKIADGSLDFVIANHALEHSPDPYGTLLKWKDKLKRHGLLYFALPIADKCFDRGRPVTTAAHLLEDHRLFTTLDIKGILKVTEEHLREFLLISDVNIRRMHQIEHVPDDLEIDRTCAGLMQPLANAMQKTGITCDDLITAHVLVLNKAYDIHYHAFSPTSLCAFTSRFCDREDCELVELKKSGGGECIALIKKRSIHDQP